NARARTRVRRVVACSSGALCRWIWFLRNEMNHGNCAYWRAYFYVESRELAAAAAAAATAAAAASGAARIVSTERFDAETLLSLCNFVSLINVIRIAQGKQRFSHFAIREDWYRATTEQRTWYSRLQPLITRHNGTSMHLSSDVK
ncbi:hypothetical protein ALC57_06155, partial [Trachymyrmex cornetzi]